MNHDGSYDTQTTCRASSLENREKSTLDPVSESQAETQALDASQDIPEGGWAGWATAVGSFLVLFSTYGYMLSFGVYQGILIIILALSPGIQKFLQDFYTQTYITNQSSSNIAWIGSTGVFLFEFSALLAGRLYDRGYFYQLLYGASLLQAFSIFMLSMARPDNYYQVFLAQGVGSGIATGLLYVPSMAVVSHWFDQRREKVMAFASSGVYFGAVMHPIMLNNTINGQLGFTNGVRASAALISGLLLIACLLMRTRLKPSESHANFLVAARRCSRDSAYILGCLGFFIFVIAPYYPLFYLQLDAVRHGLDNTFAFYSLVIMNAASFFGQLSCTILLGFFRVHTLLITATLCCSVVLFGMAGLHTVTGIVVFSLLYGYFAGIFLSLCTSVWVLLTPDLSELGVRMGIGSAVMAFGGLISPPISGALLTPAYIWWRGAVFSGSAAALGCAIFVAMARILARRSRTLRATSESVSATETSTRSSYTEPGDLTVEVSPGS